MGNLFKCGLSHPFPRLYLTTLPPRQRESSPHRRDTEREGQEAGGSREKLQATGKSCGGWVLQRHGLPSPPSQEILTPRSE